MGPYEIVQRIGAGGMGTVYEGRDTRLDRTVAIKASEAAFGGRLEREARAVSSLNHPHICTLHDIVEQDGAAYLVMEYVKGTTLADRLARGPLPFEDVIRYGTQIAAALAAAHARGIIHRDLKPANIMLTEDGVKVLDFGLAKVAARPSSEQAATQSVTAPHTILGTLQYMAPEQLEGKECDERADIFALGLVLYEMAEGRKAFDAESGAGLIAEIMRCEPQALKTGTPQFRRTVKRCLMKDPAQRWHSAADVRIDIEEPPAEQAVAPPPRLKRLRAVLIAAVGLLAGFAAAAFWPLDPSPFPAVTPLATEFEVQTMPAWSPKGDRLAYIAAVDGVFQVFTKGLTASSPTQRTKSQHSCASPFWSADGTRIYFLSRGELWSVPVAGGEPELVGPARQAALSPDGQRMAVMNPRLAFASPPGAAPVPYAPLKAGSRVFPHLEFNRDGTHLGLSFTQRGQVGFTSVPMNGGAPRESSTTAMGYVSGFTWLPGGNRIVLSGIRAEQTLRAKNMQMALWDLSSGRLRPLTDETTWGEFPALSPDGRTLAYAQGRHDFDLVEVALDTSGVVRSLLQTSRMELAPCWSPNGTHFAYTTDRNGQFEMRLRDRRDGSERLILSETDLPGGGVIFYRCAFSPDGQRLAVHTYQRGTQGMWVSALSGEAPVSVVQDVGIAPSPDWSPDGKWIVFQGLHEGKVSVMKVAPGSRDPQLLTSSDVATLGAAVQWSPKGDWIVYRGGDGLEAISPQGKDKHTVSGHPWIEFGWQKDGSALFGIFGDTKRRLKLGRIDFPSGRETILADLGPQAAVGGAITHGHPPYMGFSIHPDGKSAILCVLSLNKSIYLMRDFDRPVRLIDRLLNR